MEKPKITQEEIKALLVEQIADSLANKKIMVQELNNVLSIEEKDGKLNCECKIMLQFDKSIVENAILFDKLK